MATVEVQKYMLTAVGPNTFRKSCYINGTPCSLLITSGSSSNLVSESLVRNLGLPLIEHPDPYKLIGLIVNDQFFVSKQSKIPFSCCDGSYKDEILFDVVTMKEECILLGRPWQYDRQVVYNGHLNQYLFEVNGNPVLLSSDEVNGKSCSEANSNSG